MNASTETTRQLVFLCHTLAWKSESTATEQTSFFGNQVYVLEFAVSILLYNGFCKTNLNGFGRALSWPNLRNALEFDWTSRRRPQFTSIRI